MVKKGYKLVSVEEIKPFAIFDMKVREESV